jgi:FtsP/CotA-like multicopper oxidase with cupredoxin domain
MLEIGLQRRHAVRVLLLVLLAFATASALAGCGNGGGGSSAQRAKPSDPNMPDFKSGMPLTEPPVLASSHHKLRTTIVAQNGTVTVSGVDIGNTQTYAAGSLPRGFLGPTLHVNPGDTVDIILDNRLEVPEDVRRSGKDKSKPQQCPPMDDSMGAMDHGMTMPPPGKQITNLHFHGTHVTPRKRTIHGEIVYGDDVLADLGPGKSHIRFHIPKDHDQGTFWYHAHRHGCTDDQVYRGLAGQLLIGDERHELPPRFRKLTTRSILLKDIEAVPYKGGWAIPNDHDWSNSNPKQRLVNGLDQPTIGIRRGETQLWRVANISSALWYNVALVDQNGGDARDVFTIVAEDGNPATRLERRRSVVLAPGHRVDILVRGPDTKRVLETLPFDQGRLTFKEAPLATVEPSGTRERPLHEPHRGVPLPHFPKERGPTRRFVFSFGPDGPSGPDTAFINGLPFNPDKPAAEPRLRTTEKWILVNRTDEWHPFHIHQNDFRVISVNGKPVRRPPGDQDVVGLPPVHKGIPGRVVILMPFQTYRGEFVFHCHILDHEDAGMMALVKVRRAAKRHRR